MSELILDILENRLGHGPYHKAANGSARGKGAEWCGPCPFCGGDDRFRVWPEQEGGKAAREAGVVGKFWCRQCDKNGDTIELLVAVKGLTFVEACKELRIELSGGPRKRRSLRALPSAPVWEPAVWAIPSEQWRSSATKLVLTAQEHLLEYEAGLKYLTGRGLPLEAVKQYSLGYLTGDDKTGKGRYRQRSVFGLEDKVSGERVKKVIWLPRGLTIPMWGPGPEGGDSVHRLRFRRRAEDLGERDPKFLLLEGSCQAPLILPPTALAADRAIWVIVEAELCAMAVHHACAGRVGVIGVLTNRGKPDAAAHKLLKTAPMILVALDFDSADEKGNRPGFQGWQWWQKIYSQAKRWPVPMGKDPGEAVGWGVDLAAWVEAALPKRSDPARPGNSGAHQVELPASGGGAVQDAVEADEQADEQQQACVHDFLTFELMLWEWDGSAKV